MALMCLFVLAFLSSNAELLFSTTVSNVYQYKDYNIQCANVESFTFETKIPCGLKCTATLCAGFTYDAKSKICGICHGQLVIGLTFGNNTYTLRTTMGIVFAPNATNTTVVETPNGLPIGTVVYVSLTPAFWDVYIQLGNPSIYNLVVRLRKGNLILVNTWNNFDTWGVSQDLVDAPVTEEYKLYTFWILVAQDGFHVYVDKALRLVFPNKFPQNEFKEIRVNGPVASLIISY